MANKIYIEITNQEEFLDSIIEPLIHKFQEILDAQNTNPKPLLTTSEMYNHLKIGRSTFLKLLFRGEIPGVRIGNQWRFDCFEVVKALKSNNVKSFKSLEND